MDYKEQCLDKAERTGHMDEASAKMSVAYMLMTQAFSLYDDSAELLRQCNLYAGQHKLLGNRVYAAFDKFFADNNVVLTKEESRDFREDFDRIKVMIDDIVNKELATSRKRKVCDICGKSKPVEDFSPKYKCRCKECVNRLRREQNEKNRPDDITFITLQLDRKKMQARQIYPNTIIVPFATAQKVVNDLIRHYNENKNKGR